MTPNKQIKRSQLCRVLVMLLLLFPISDSNSQVVHNGKLDLSDWDINKDPILELNGVWDFYPGIRSPSLISDISPEPLNVPGYWQHNYWKSFGFGIYHLKIVNSPSNKLSIKLGKVQMAYQVWLDNELIEEVGKVSTHKEDYQPKLRSKTITLAPRNKNFDLFIYISNYNHRRTGIFGSIKIGNVEAIERSYQLGLIEDAFLITLIITVAFYALSLYIFDKRKILYLNFCIFCLLAVLRISVINELILPKVFEEIPDWLMTILQYVGFILSAGFIGKFQSNILTTPIGKRNANIFFKISIAFSLLIILTPDWLNSHVSLVFQLLTLIAVPTVFTEYKKIMKSSSISTLVLIVGFSLLILIFLHDVLVASRIFNGDYWQGYGYALYAISQAIYFGLEHRTLSQKVSVLHQHLLEFGLVHEKKEAFERKLIEEIGNLKQDLSINSDKEKILNLLKSIDKRPAVPIKQQLISKNIDSINEDFLFILEKKFPSLTTSEKELCICFKAKMSTKEIASLRGVSPDSIKKARTRLRKKINIDRNIDLNEFLNELVQ